VAYCAPVERAVNDDPPVVLAGDDALGVGASRTAEPTAVSGTEADDRSGPALPEADLFCDPEVDPSRESAPCSVLLDCSELLFSVYCTLF
jgi:hypothetical protein